MAGPWKAWKTKPRFPPLSTVPWKSGQPRRISTFPPPRIFLFPFPQKPKLKKGSRPLRGLPIPILFRIILYWKRYFVSGSSLDWKMLRGVTSGANEKSARLQALIELRVDSYGSGAKVERQALNELPQPHVDFTLGFSNLKPEPSSVST